MLRTYFISFFFLNENESNELDFTKNLWLCTTRQWQNWHLIARGCSDQALQLHVYNVIRNNIFWLVQLTPRSLCFLDERESFPSPEQCDWSPFKLKTSSTITASDRLEFERDFSTLAWRPFFGVDEPKLLSEKSQDWLTLESFTTSNSMTTFGERLEFEWNCGMLFPWLFIGVEGWKVPPEFAKFSAVVLVFWSPTFWSFRLLNGSTASLFSSDIRLNHGTILAHDCPLERKQWKFLLCTWS